MSNLSDEQISDLWMTAHSLGFSEFKRLALAAIESAVREKGGGAPREWNSGLCENCTVPTGYWEQEARRYAGNADFWRKRCEAIPGEIAASPSVAGMPAEPTARIAEAWNLLAASCHALRSYQYGNGDEDLAKAIADKIDEFLAVDPAASSPAPSGSEKPSEGA
jgi:hypothetical protein